MHSKCSGSVEADVEWEYCNLIKSVGFCATTSQSLTILAGRLNFPSNLHALTDEKIRLSDKNTVATCNAQHLFELALSLGMVEQSALGFSVTQPESG